MIMLYSFKGKFFNENFKKTLLTICVIGEVLYCFIVTAIIVKGNLIKPN